MYSYDPSAWHELLTAVAGASAALAGLMFVAVSINLRQILKVPVLPPRAAAVLGALFLALIVSVLALAPGQSSTFLGAELLVCALPTGLATTYGHLRHGRDERQSRFWYGVGLTLAELAVVPVIGAGISLIAGAGGGLYWLLPAFVFVFISTGLQGWVLLVEIMR